MMKYFLKKIIKLKKTNIFIQENFMGVPTEDYLSRKNKIHELNLYRIFPC
jgi:hypothetical protein